MKYYPLTLSIIDTINEWDEKLNAFASSNMDNVLIGALVLGGIIVISFWGIGVLTKR